VARYVETLRADHSAYLDELRKANVVRHDTTERWSVIAAEVAAALAR